MENTQTESTNSPSGSSVAVTLHINGEPYTCASQTTLPDLIEQLGLNSRLVAVEYNGEILHRQFWGGTEVQVGDRLEIVTIIGGG